MSAYLPRRPHVGFDHEVEHGRGVVGLVLPPVGRSGRARRRRVRSRGLGAREGQGYRELKPVVLQILKQREKLQIHMKLRILTFYHLQVE